MHINALNILACRYSTLFTSSNSLFLFLQQWQQHRLLKLFTSSNASNTLAELLLNGGRALVSITDTDTSLWLKVIKSILHIFFVIARNCRLLCLRHWFGPRGVVAAIAALALLHGRKYQKKTTPLGQVNEEVGQLAERVLLTVASRCPTKLLEVFKPCVGMDVHEYGTRSRHANKLRAVWKRLRQRHSLLSSMVDGSSPLRRLQVCDALHFLSLNDQTRASLQKTRSFIRL